MKYAIFMSLIGAAAFIVGCDPETKPSDTTGSGGSESSSSSSSSSSGSAGAGGMGSGGAGGMGTSSSSSGGGGSMVCDNATVVDKVDPAMRCTGAANDMVVNTVMAPANMVWADSADPNGFSSQFSPADYGVIQATGAPDVYPTAADEPKAWASQTMDDIDEFITLGFKTPVVAESVWVFQTFNPGAITKITIKTADGDQVVYTGTAEPIGACAHVLSVSTKTCSPISSVRIDLGSKAVPGYNEIDAVGLLPAK
jgi:hypothetical protein